MAVFLPIACFLALWPAFVRRKGGSLREAFLAAAVVWGLLTAGITELLGAFRQLTPAMLASAWAAATLAAAAFVLRPPRFAPLLPGRRLPRLTELALAACVGLALLLTLATALWSAPNNYDSLTYHLPRVTRWLQNRSVEFFPTNFTPQLHNPPWGAYAVLNLLALKGDDRLVNLVQWFSLCGCVVGASLIAARLGAAPRTQLFAAVFCATLPMGILQASNATNSCATAFWLICLVYYLLRLHAAPTWGDAGWAGASLGLALLTKPTAYVFAAPLTAWLLGAWLFRPREPWPRLAARFAALLAIPLAMNTPYYIRNYALYGAVLGPGKEGDAGQFDYQNATHTPAALASNVVRNVGMELRTPSGRANALLERAVAGCHGWLGMDVNDSRTTWPGCTFASGADTPFYEDVAGDFPHTLLILAIGAAALVCGGLWRDGRVAGLGGALLLGLLLFCFVFRWQPWHNRLHLPLFFLAAPLVAVGLGRLRPAVLLAAAVVLTAWAWPFLVGNQLRPLTGPGNVRKAARVAMYFKAVPSLQAPYAEAARLLRERGCRSVGVSAEIDAIEYPLWVLMNPRGLGGCRVEDVGVRNVSARAVGDAFRPDGLIVLREERPSRLVLGGDGYRSVWSCDVLAVYLRERD